MKKIQLKELLANNNYKKNFSWRNFSNLSTTKWENIKVVCSYVFIFNENYKY